MATNEQYKTYLSELIAYYRKYRTLSGSSAIAQRCKVSHFPKELFFRFGLDKKGVEELTSAEVLACREALNERKRENAAAHCRKLMLDGGNDDGDRLSLRPTDFDDVPEGFELIKISESEEYGYALRCDLPVDHAGHFMYLMDRDRNVASEIYARLSGCLGDKVDEVYECRLPLLFINGRADYTPLYMAKCDNNGTSYYIAKSPLILLCLARMCKLLEKEGWK